MRISDSFIIVSLIGGLYELKMEYHDLPQAKVYSSIEMTISLQSEKEEKEDEEETTASTTTEKKIQTRLPVVRRVKTKQQVITY